MMASACQPSAVYTQTEVNCYLYYLLLLSMLPISSSMNLRKLLTSMFD